MADLQPAQIPNFSLGSNNIPYQGNWATGLASGVQSSIKNVQAQQQINQQAQQVAIQQQQLALQKQKQQQEQGMMVTKNALDAYDAYGDAAGAESFHAFKQGMNMLAPGSIDPNAQWDSSMGEALKTANDAFAAGAEGKRPWPEAIGVIAKTISQASKQQRARMQPILQSAQDQFNQQESTSRQESSQSQDTQRAYAEHAQPMIQAGSVLNTIDQSLAEKTPTGDAVAKANIEKLVANGGIPKDDVDRLTTAGGPLERIGQYWHTIGTGKQYDDTHREAMRRWISTKVNELNNTLQSTATAFPGARPARIISPKDAHAINWARQHPDDPKAALILQKAQGQ